MKTFKRLLVVAFFVALSMSSAAFAKTTKPQKPKTITVKFFSTSGKEYTALRKKVAAGKKITIPSIPRRNAAWAGWALTSGATFARYGCGEKIAFSGNAKLYAVKWDNQYGLGKFSQKIYSSAVEMDRTMQEMQKAHPGIWYYRNGMGTTTFKQAIAQKQTWVDCYHAVWWVIRNAGYDRKKIYRVYHYDGKYTAKQLLAKGMLKPGDYINYKNAEHVNMYLGNNMWFDAGRVYMPYGAHPPFIKWIGEGCFLGNTVYDLYSLKEKKTVLKTEVKSGFSSIAR